MFTGIIEAFGTVREVAQRGQNKTFWLQSALAAELKVDQSLSHNGVCLTVEEVRGDHYRVTAVPETLEKTNLHEWGPGALVNLERSLLPSSRLDGHFVQGHVDSTGICEVIDDRGGSWEMRFWFPKAFAPLVIEKGSIALNGVSLTVFNVRKKHFTVAVIPYTYTHTNLHLLHEGSLVNLEFDLLGKYLQRRAVLKNEGR
ncbi:riboflavin synthase [Flaviaesturariibacter aridisoli]|uniref:Riboflavin synthase n=1 Tax=Flaviaesturariibacter aridisoli TaxID=2545761 RepID=A0A4V2WN95_9BACT|nr:riboflavin synthase [Flaviaesturariibacter aridisoli]TCZ74582.1 riboflavin synthase [Flaviaesturariibacter aridisoli]